ncbi:hypothetical protein D3C85_1381680 [compost metagenome]
MAPGEAIFIAEAASLLFCQRGGGRNLWKFRVGLCPPRLALATERDRREIRGELCALHMFRAGMSLTGARQGHLAVHNDVAQHNRCGTLVRPQALDVTMLRLLVAHRTPLDNEGPPRSARPNERLSSCQVVFGPAPTVGVWSCNRAAAAEINAARMPGGVR